MNKFAESIEIGKFTISATSPAFIIAEIGSNHNQSVVTAKEHIDAALAAGANAVKFQSLDFSQQYLENATPAATKKIHKKVDFSDEQMREVAIYSTKRGIIFLSSPTYIESVDFLETLKVPLYKIASPITVGFTALIEKVARTRKPIIVSTGYCSKDDISRAVATVQKSGNNKMIMLYCTSQYPTEAKDINFNYMKNLGKKYHCIIGFSDHSMSTSIPAIAVAAGARVIEKHLTLSRKMKGPDHPFAIEPEEFRQMVKNIREAELVMQPIKTAWRKMLPPEIALKEMMITKLVTATELPKGIKIHREHVIFRRAPEGEGIPEYKLHDIIGKTLKRPLKKFSLIQKTDVG